MYWDIAIVETLNGGDLVLTGQDIAVVNGVENMPYLGMFGGNVEAVTENLNIPTTGQNLDWFGNKLYFNNNPSVQMNSYTEKSFKDNSLTSSGRVLIENAIRRDLKFLQQMDVVIEIVNVTIVSTDRIEIKFRVKINPDSQEKIVIAVFVLRDGDFYLEDFDPNDFF